MKPYFRYTFLPLALFLCVISAFANVKPKPYDSNKAWVDATLAKMTLDEKIGQLFIIDYNVEALRGNVRSTTNAVNDLHIGGFLVRKTMDPNTIMRETKRLQNLTDIPLFFGADYERGAGYNGNYLTEFPSNMALGATRNTQLAEQMGRIVAQESRILGVNLLFAPVADVNNNPDNPIINIRSYGENPNLVAEMAEAFVRGAERNGLLTTLKHFPGHGNTSTDSHSNLGIVRGSRAELDRVELLPYKQILRSDTPPSLVMTAHLAVPAIDDSGLPATFSKKVLQGVLRQDLNFEGIIITDGINMGAISNNYPYDETILRPLEAGADIVLLPDNPRRAVEAVRQALASGRLTEERIEESVRRILNAKAKIRTTVTDKFEVPDAGRLISSGAIQVDGSGREVARRIAENSVTLLRNGQTLPIQSGQKVAVMQMTYMRTSDGLGTTMDEFSRQLKSVASITDCRLTARASVCDNQRTTQAKMLENVRNADVVVLNFYLRPSERRGNVALNPEQQALANAIMQSGKPVVIATFGNPYIAENFPSASAVIVSYDQTTFSANAVAHVIMGISEAKGKLPVSVGDFGFGSNMGMDVAPRTPAPTSVPPKKEASTAPSGNGRNWKLRTF
jgi:beta-N-acetylhexosaminidase